MGLQSSGAIDLQDVADEFGGSTPHGISEYYRNGSYVTENNTGIPTSGTIDMADFYGTVRASIQTLSNSTNQNVSSIFGSDFSTNIPKILIIPSGVTIGGTGFGSGNRAITVPSGMSSTLDIQNAGTISGSGGSGGSAGGGNGGTGGSAIYIQSSGVTVTNSGTIRGGGGGGAGGNNGSAGNSNYAYNIKCIGGSAGSGGSGGRGEGYDGGAQGGSSGTSGGGPTSNGQASQAAWFCGRVSPPAWNSGNAGGSGASGGSFGNAGGNAGGSGGQAGYYVETSGVSYTLSNSGTVQGRS